MSAKLLPKQVDHMAKIIQLRPPKNKGTTTNESLKCAHCGYVAHSKDELLVAADLLKKDGLPRKVGFRYHSGRFVCPNEECLTIRKDTFFDDMISSDETAIMVRIPYAKLRDMIGRQEYDEKHKFFLGVAIENAIAPHLEEQEDLLTAFDIDPM